MSLPIWLRLLIVALLALGAAPASAQDARTIYAELSFDARTALQLALIWTGDYNGMMDGAIGPRSVDAIRSFQRRNGYRADGILSGVEADALFDEAARELVRTGFEVVRDDATGTDVGLPLALVRFTGMTALGSRYANRAGDIEIETLLIDQRGRTLADLFRQLTGRQEYGRVVAYQAFAGSWFVINGTEDGKTFYARFHARPGAGEIVGFSASWDAMAHPRVDRVAVAMSNAFVPFPAPAQVARAPAPRAPAPPPASVRPPVGGVAEPLPPGEAGGIIQTGTGFVIAQGGWILTNAHVVEGCTLVYVGSAGSTTEIRRDVENDLALVRLADVDLGPPLPLAPGGAALGEEAVAFGYPLSDMLGEALNVTEGIVSSLSGPRGDRRYLQTSAAVQPGNSGGPLLDERGFVLGVVTGKLSLQLALREAGVVPEGVNFAIKSELVAGFLLTNQVAPARGDAGGPALSTRQIAERASGAVVPLSCRVG